MKRSLRMPSQPKIAQCRVIESLSECGHFDGDSKRLSPHPGPLPWGEGESFSRSSNRERWTWQKILWIRKNFFAANISLRVFAFPDEFVLVHRPRQAGSRFSSEIRQERHRNLC